LEWLCDPSQNLFFLIQKPSHILAREERGERIIVLFTGVSPLFQRASRILRLDEAAEGIVTDLPHIVADNPELPAGGGKRRGKWLPSSQNHHKTQEAFHQSIGLTS